MAWKNSVAVLSIFMLIFMSVSSIHAAEVIPLVKGSSSAALIAEKEAAEAATQDPRLSPLLKRYSQLVERLETIKNSDSKEPQNQTQIRRLTQNIEEINRAIAAVKAMTPEGTSSASSSPVSVTLSAADTKPSGNSRLSATPPVADNDKPQNPPIVNVALQAPPAQDDNSGHVASFSPGSADLNGDGIVNFADLNILLSNFGLISPETSIQHLGDVNQDGTINFTDMNMLVAAFGFTLNADAPQMLCNSITVTFEGPVTIINDNDDITFYFQDPVECGNFADGSPWVMGVNGSPVIVTRITPDIVGLVAADITTWPAEIARAIQDHMEFRVNDEFCHLSLSPSPTCITVAEAQPVVDFFINEFKYRYQSGHNTIDRSHTTYYLNGYQMNTDPENELNMLDPRIADYGRGDNAGFTVPPLLPKYDLAGNAIPGTGEPLVLNPASNDAISLLKAVSRYEIKQFNCNNVVGPFNKWKEEYGNGSYGRGCMHSLAILTVVGTRPPEDAFRPPYVKLPYPKLALPGTNKPYYQVSDVDMGRIPTLSPQGLATLNYSNLMKSLAAPHTHKFNGWPAVSFQQPVNNFKDVGGNLSAHYHSSISNVVNAAMLYSMLDVPLEQRTAPMKKMVQLGLDNYWNLHGGKSYASGTGFNMGAKAPILYAGKLLNSQTLLDVGRDFGSRPGGLVVPNGMPGSYYFAEDQQTYETNEITFAGKKLGLWANADSSQNMPLTPENLAGRMYTRVTPHRPLTEVYPDILEKMPANGGYNGFIGYFNEPSVGFTCASSYGNRVIRDPMGRRHGGYWTSLNTQHRPVVGTNTDGTPRYSCPRTHDLEDILAGTAPAGASSYQDCCSSFPIMGAYTVARLLGVEDEWNHPAFFRYAELWASPFYSRTASPRRLAGGYLNWFINSVFFTHLYPQLLTEPFYGALHEAGENSPYSMNQ